MSGHRAACKEEPARLEIGRKTTAELQAGRRGYVALWKQFCSLEAQEKDFVALDAHFDLFLGESDADPLVAPMIANLTIKGLAVEGNLRSEELGDKADTGGETLGDLAAFAFN